MKSVGSFYLHRLLSLSTDKTFQYLSMKSAAAVWARYDPRTVTIQLQNYPSLIKHFSNRTYYQYLYGGTKMGSCHGLPRKGLAGTEGAPHFPNRRKKYEFLKLKAHVLEFSF